MTFQVFLAFLIKIKIRHRLMWFVA